MSRHAKFNSGRSGRTSGINPKDHHVVAGSHKPSGLRKIGKKADEFLFKKYCEEVLRDRFEPLVAEDLFDLEQQRQVLNDVVREVYTSREFARINPKKKWALLLGVASIVIANIAGESVTGELLKDLHLDSALRATSGALVGGVVGGPIGAAVGAGIMMVPAVEAKAVRGVESKAKTTSTGKPETSVKPKVSKNLRSQVVDVAAEKRVKSKYEISELMMPKDQIFVANDKASDWALTLGGRLIPLSELMKNSGVDLVVDDEKYRNTNFVLIKNEALKNLIEKGDYDGFRSLMRQAGAELRKEFDRAGVVFRDTVWKTIRYLHSEERKKRNISDFEIVVEMFSDDLSEITGIERDVIESRMTRVVKELGLAYQKGRAKEDYSLGSSDFQQILKRNLRDIVFDEPTEEVLDSIELRVLEFDDGVYSKALERFEQMQEKSVLRELYDHRIEAARRFVSRPDSKVVVIDEYDKKVRRDALLRGGFEISNQRNSFTFNTIAMRGGVSDQVFTHEMMHHRDTEVCRMVGDSLLDLDSDKIRNKIPCGTSDEVNGKTAHDLVQAVIRDYKRLRAVQKEKKDTVLTVEFVSHVMRSLELFNEVINNPMAISNAEILPMITDRLDPTQLMLAMPNVAVIRADRIIFQTGRESELYAAMMRCDLSKVRAMVTKNPAILDEEYDSIPLHQISKVLVDAQYDLFVDPKLKEGGKDSENSYKEINDFIQSQYSLHQATKKLRSGHANSGAGRGSEL